MDKTGKKKMNISGALPPAQSVTPSPSGQSAQFSMHRHTMPSAVNHTTSNTGVLNNVSLTQLIAALSDYTPHKHHHKAYEAADTVPAPTTKVSS